MYSTYDYSSAGVLAGLGIALVIIVVILLLLVIAAVVVNVFYFKKIGRKGWEAIIPFYNNYCLVQAAGLEKYWFYVTLAPLAGAVLSYIPILGGIISFICTIASLFATIAIYYNINKKLGKDTVWTVLAILLTFIYEIIIIVDKKVVFNESAEVNPDGPFENIVNSIKGMFGKKNQTSASQQPSQTSTPTLNAGNEERPVEQPTDNTDNK